MKVTRSLKQPLVMPVFLLMFGEGGRGDSDVLGFPVAFSFFSFLTFTELTAKLLDE